MRENSTSILQREIKHYRVYRNMKGSILETNLEGKWWKSRLFTILFTLTGGEGNFGEGKRRRRVLEVVLPGRGQMTYLGEGMVCLGDQG